MLFYQIKIKKKLSDVVSELDLPDNFRIHPVFHISKLKKYIQYDNQFPIRTQINSNNNSRPLPEMYNNNDDIPEYEVEKILDKREIKRGRNRIIQYLIKWKGYPEYESTWEPMTNLINAPDIIREYEMDSNNM